MSAGSPTRWFLPRGDPASARGARTAAAQRPERANLRHVERWRARRRGAAACSLKALGGLCSTSPAQGWIYIKRRGSWGASGPGSKRKETEVVVVVHDLNLCAQYADECLLIDDGTLQAQGPADEL